MHCCCRSTLTVLMAADRPDRADGPYVEASEVGPRAWRLVQSWQNVTNLIAKSQYNFYRVMSTRFWPRKISICGCDMFIMTASFLSYNEVQRLFMAAWHVRTIKNHMERLCGQSTCPCAECFMQPLVGSQDRTSHTGLHPHTFCTGTGEMAKRLEDGTVEWSQCCECETCKEIHPSDCCDCDCEERRTRHTHTIQTR